jgi:hypothetical protein
MTLIVLIVLRHSLDQLRITAQHGSGVNIMLDVERLLRVNIVWKKNCWM